MANYITHIAEVNYQKEIPKQALDFLNAYGIKVDDKFYYKYETPSAANYTNLQELSRLMCGQPIKCFIYSEDPGKSIFHGTITSPLETISLKSEMPNSTTAIEMYESFSQLSKYIESFQPARETLLPVGLLSGVVDEQHYHVYVAKTSDQRILVTQDPDDIDTWNSQRNWTPISQGHLSKLQTQMTFIPFNPLAPEIKEKEKILIGRDVVRYSNSNFKIDTIDKAKQFFEALAARLNSKGHGNSTKVTIDEGNGLKIDLHNGCSLNLELTINGPSIILSTPSNLNLRESKLPILHDSLKIVSILFNSTSPSMKWSELFPAPKRQFLKFKF